MRIITLSSSTVDRLFFAVPITKKSPIHDHTLYPAAQFSAITEKRNVNFMTNCIYLRFIYILYFAGRLIWWMKPLAAVGILFVP